MTVDQGMCRDGATHLWTDWAVDTPPYCARCGSVQPAPDDTLRGRLEALLEVCADQVLPFPGTATAVLDLWAATLAAWSVDAHQADNRHGRTCPAAHANVSAAAWSSRSVTANRLTGTRKTLSICRVLRLT